MDRVKFETAATQEQHSQASIDSDSDSTFLSACENGDLPALNRLVELAPGLVSLMIEANDYAAFRSATEYGHLPVLNRLMELAPDRLPRMIEVNGYAAFSYLARCRMDDTVNRALCDPDVFAHAALHEDEHAERYVNPFIHNALTALRAMKTSFELENPSAVFNIADETQAKHYLHMIRNLIGRNDRALLDDARFLLAIPAVKALAHTPVTSDDCNELVRLALTTGQQEAAAVLLAIPAVHAIAIQDEFYYCEVDGQLYLEALAGNRESSMRALSKSEQQRLQAATSCYEPLIKAAKDEGPPPTKKRNLSQLGESNQSDAKNHKKATLEGLAACGTFRATAGVSQNSPTRTLSEESGSSAAI